MAFNSTLTIGTNTYERLDTGRYINVASTADQPILLTLKSTIDPNATSNYLVRFEQMKNSSVPGAEDDKLSVHMVIKLPLKAFNQTDVENYISQVNSFLTSANLTKLMRGER